MKIRWSPLAIARVSEIAEYVARDDPAAAARWVEAVFARVKQTHDFARSGRFVPEVPRRDLRELVFGNYRIIYRLDARYASILTVRHFRQILPLGDVTERGT